MPEVAGEGALLVDPFDVEAIRTQINQVIASEELRASMISNGLVNVKRFQPNAIAAQYMAVYETLKEINA